MYQCPDFLLHIFINILWMKTPMDQFVSYWRTNSSLQRVYALFLCNSDRLIEKTAQSKKPSFGRAASNIPAFLPHQWSTRVRQNGRRYRNVNEFLCQRRQCCTVGVALKCSPKKNPPGRDNHEIDMYLPYLNIAGQWRIQSSRPLKSATCCRSHKKFPHYRIIPHKSLPRPTIYRQKSVPLIRRPPGGGFLPGAILYWGTSYIGCVCVSIYRRRRRQRSTRHVSRQQPTVHERWIVNVTTHDARCCMAPSSGQFSSPISPARLQLTPKASGYDRRVKTIPRSVR